MKNNQIKDANEMHSGKCSVHVLSQPLLQQFGQFLFSLTLVSSPTLGKCGTKYNLLCYF